jgi:hypothetical protein
VTIVNTGSWVAVRVCPNPTGSSIGRKPQIMLGQNRVLCIPQHLVRQLHRLLGIGTRHDRLPPVLRHPCRAAFLARFDCQGRADWLTPKRLGAFLAGIRYCGSTTPEAMHARITAAPPGATGDAGAAAVHVTRALLAALRALVEQIDALTDQITEQLRAHADAHIFTSLPRAGTVRAARLLAEIGDARS